MRIVSFCLAAVLALAGIAHAAEPAGAGLDFSIEPFAGGNTNPDWSVRLTRTDVGMVQFNLAAQSRRLTAQGVVRSVKPELNLPSVGKLKGKYGLAGTVTIGLESLPVSVLVGPSAAGVPCQDRAGKKYGNAVIFVIGPQRKPEDVFYGCGEYVKP